MYSRNLSFPNNSAFLFGPRGTGKSWLLQDKFKNDIIIDLLNSQTHIYLSANPSRLETLITDPKKTVVIDEIQKIPELLDEVHRLIETKNIRFILTGSSTRKLRQKGVNLLAGRAIVLSFYPLIVDELKKDFSLSHSLKFGFLPTVYRTKDPQEYLTSYVKTYIDEEVKQEGLTRNIGGFYRFLESASLSQGSPLNISAIARDCGVNRKVVEDYFIILEDLMLAERLPVFTKRAKRKVVSHPKFYFFDSGVYRTIRPKGPLDSPEEIDGIALETIIYQQLKAYNDYYKLKHQLFYWQTQSSKHEVDFVLYGENGLKAFEVKRSDKVNSKDLKGLREFGKEYPMAELRFLYCGNKPLLIDGIKIEPIEDFLFNIKDILD